MSILWAILWFGIGAAVMFALVVGGIMWLLRHDGDPESLPFTGRTAPRHAAVRPRLTAPKAGDYVWMQRDHPGPLRVVLAHKRPPTEEMEKLIAASDAEWDRIHVKLPTKTGQEITA